MQLYHETNPTQSVRYWSILETSKICKKRLLGSGKNVIDDHLVSCCEYSKQYRNGVDIIVTQAVSIGIKNVVLHLDRIIMI